MTMYPVHQSIVRREEQPTMDCANGDGRIDPKQLAIRREKPMDAEVEHWHFACALLNEIVIEDTIVRMARAFKGPTY